MRKLVFGILFLWIVLIPVVLKNWPSQYLKFVVCDVGQGDAILIEYGFDQILVDGGLTGRAVMDCLSQHMPWGDKILELVVATHADADHIGGLVDVIQGYEVRRLIVNGEVKENDVFDQFKNAVQKKMKGMMVLDVPDYGDWWIIGKKLIVQNISTRGSSCSESLQNLLKTETTLQDNNCKNEMEEVSSNDRSIALFVYFGEVKILLTGDLEVKGEQALVDSGVLTKTTILKAGHHGSKTSSNTDFLSMTQPEIVVISVGKNNRYNHPSPEVLTRLQTYNSKILRTDELGSIVILSDGLRVWQTDLKSLNN